MKVTLENEKDNVVKVNITIPAEEATTAYNTAARKIAQYVNVDGFRKGKAPRHLVERQVGEERIKQEALEGLMPKVLSEVIEENKLDVITQPYITSYDFKKGEDLNVVVNVETRPEVKLGDYKNLTVEVTDVPVTEDAVTETLDRIQKNYTEHKIVERESKNTDTVNIDFEGFANNEAIKGGAAKNYDLNLEHSNFIPGFADQLVGKKAGEEFDIQVKFPEDYHDESLKGQDATFKIKVNAVKEAVVPELNDELAQKAGNFKTVDELKEDVKKRLEESRENAKKVNAENEIFKKVIENASVEIPEAMIDREANAMLADYKNRLSAQGIDWESLMKATEGTDNDVMKNIREDAKLRIKNSLVIDKIAKEEGIKLAPADIDNKFKELGNAYGVSPDQIIKSISKNPEILSSLSQQAVNDKVRALLFENNKAEFKEAQPESK